MANIKSQQKRILTNERRRLRNKSVKSSLHTAVRAFRTAAAEGDKDKAMAEMEVQYKAVMEGVERALAGKPAQRTAKAKP